jgi:hypothetical protein
MGALVGDAPGCAILAVQIIAGSHAGACGLVIVEPT